MEFIDFLLIIIAILYIIRLVFRVVLPMLFQKVVNKAQEQQQNYQQNYTRSTKTTNGVKVDYIPETPKGKIPDSEGDFIDYEEIK
jgi:hypothetical protein